MFEWKGISEGNKLCWATSDITKGFEKVSNVPPDGALCSRGGLVVDVSPKN